MRTEPTQEDAPATSETVELSEDEQAPSALPEAPIPARIGRYTVIDRLGRGGMGSVYRAYDARLRREVALKQVRADRLTPEAEARLVREAQAMARLSHPNVVAVYDVEPGESLTLAMEFVPGQSLARWLEQDHAWTEVLAVYLRAGRGLAAAHAVGLVHRDFKPANVLLGDDGTTKVTDFGLAKGDGQHDAPSSVGLLGELDDSLCDATSPVTMADTVMGTPRYMAPEQHTGGGADARGDQYSFCVALWEALAGAPPFKARNYELLAAAKLEGPPPWPRSQAVPSAVVRAMSRGLQPEPADRHPSMNALLDLLESATRRRRRWWGVGGAVGGLLGVGGIALSAASPSDACTGAEAAMIGVWDEDTRARVREGLLAHDAGYAEDTWTRVEASLDDYAGAWKQQHRESCEATTVRGEQSSTVMDRRMQCLERAKTELQEGVELLANADVEVLRRAVGMVDALPLLSTCEDVARLMAESPLPADPAEAARVLEAETELARIRSTAVAGKHQQAFDAMQTLYESHADVDHPPLRAKMEYERGLRQRQLSRYDEAQASFQRALALALEHDVDRTATHAARELGRVVGLDRAQPDVGLGYTDVARGLARRVEPDGRLEASVLDARGVLRFAKADYEGAAREHREALALNEAIVGADHWVLAAGLVNLGMAVEVLGDYDAAAEHQTRALALAEEHFGTEHPKIAKYTLNLGNVRFAQGRYEDAAVHYQRAQEILQATYGPRHAAIATTIHNLGLIDLKRGDMTRAEARVRKAMDIRLAVHGPDHPEIADSWTMLSVIAMQDERLEDSLEPALRALEIREKLHGPENLHVGKLRINLGLTLTSLKRYDEAEEQFQQGLKIKIAAMGADHQEAGQAWHNLASLSRSRGRLPEAIERWGKSLAILRPAVGEDHPLVGHAENGLGKAYLESGQPAAARELLAHVLEIREKVTTAPCKRADTELALAKALWSTPQDRPRALELATAAARRCDNEQGSAEIEAWLAEHASEPR